MPMLLSKLFLTTYYAGGEYYSFREINQVHSDARNSIVSMDKIEFSNYGEKNTMHIECDMNVLIQIHGRIQRGVGPDPTWKITSGYRFP